MEVALSSPPVEPLTLQVSPSPPLTTPAGGLPYIPELASGRLPHGCPPLCKLGHPSRVLGLKQMAQGWLYLSKALIATNCGPLPDAQESRCMHHCPGWRQHV